MPSPSTLPAAADPVCLSSRSQSTPPTGRTRVRSGTWFQEVHRGPPLSAQKFRKLFAKAREDVIITASLCVDVSCIYEFLQNAIAPFPRSYFPTSLTKSFFTQNLPFSFVLKEKVHSIVTQFRHLAISLLCVVLPHRMFVSHREA